MNRSMRIITEKLVAVEEGDNVFFDMVQPPGVIETRYVWLFHEGKEHIERFTDSIKLPEKFKQLLKLHALPLTARDKDQ